MKILVLRASARKNRVTDTLADAVCEGAKCAGAELENIRLADADIAECRGCFHCSSNNGVCVIKDDMQKILPKFQQADIIVCAGPLYFYSMNAQCKKFFDRCFPLVRNYPDFIREVGADGSGSCAKKKFFAITCALGRDLGSFECLDVLYKKICAALDMQFAGHAMRGESAYFGELGANSVRIKKTTAAFFEIGRHLAEGLTPDKQTLSTASQPICPDADLFCRRAKIFWDTLKNGHQKNV